MNAPYNRNVASAYAQVGMETGVEAADPHRLVSMLFEGALQALYGAKSAMAAKDVPTKGRLISHAIRIIAEGLQASLDKAAGGELAQNLDALYTWMATRLFFANAENDPAKLDEVAGLLSGLKDTWDQIPQKLQEQAPAAAPQPVAAAPAPGLPAGILPTEAAPREQRSYGRA